MSKKKQVKPEWFEGVVYQEGTTVRNPFSGESYELNALELSIYDFVVGANMFLEQQLTSKEEAKKYEKILLDLHRGLDWFRDNNAKAYMALLD